MKQFVASLLLCFCAWPLYGEVAHFRVGEKIELAAGFEADDYDWQIPGADFVEIDNGKTVYVWASPEKSGDAKAYHWDAAGALIVDGKAQIKREQGDFDVSAVDAPPPPAPIPETLRNLVTAEEATKIAQYFKILAGEVPKIPPEQFWLVLDGSFPVKGNVALDVAIRKRLEGPVEKKEGLSLVLLELAQEFLADSPTPPPTPVVTAKKLWIVAIDDADTRVPQQTVVLQDPELWTESGHQYEHYERGSDAAKPFAEYKRFEDEVFFQDATSGKVLGIEAIPPAANKDWATLLIQKYSGAR